MKVSKCQSIKMLLNFVAFFKLIVMMVFEHLGLLKPCQSIKMLLNLVAFFKLIVTMVFEHLGLLKPSEDVTNSTEEDQHSTSYVIVLDHLCPLIIPVHVLTAHIKKLPVVEFSQVVTRYKGNEDDGEVLVCNICLDCIKSSNEVREQRNCDHLFHRECLDSWIDQSQVTCPLCRSMLFPSKTSSMDDVGSLLW